MLEFVRNFSEDEVTLLKGLGKYEPTRFSKNKIWHHYHVPRQFGTNLKSISKRVSENVRSSTSNYERRGMCPPEHLVKTMLTFKLLERVFYENHIPLKNELDTIAEMVGSVSEETDDGSPLHKLYRSVGRTLRSNPSANAEVLRRAIREGLSPEYYYLNRDLGWPHAKIERLISGLQGIISIQCSTSFRYYSSLFIPVHVYEKVAPALEGDNKHRFVMEIGNEEEQILDTLTYIHRKSVELRKKYGNNFKARFAKQELCRETGMDKVPRREFMTFMANLEGIVGRIERVWGNSVQEKDGSDKIVRHLMPWWFLPFKHQQILEASGYAPIAHMQ